MVLLPHRAFIGLDGFYIIESAEILHDYIIMYHSKMLQVWWQQQEIIYNVCEHHVYVGMCHFPRTFRSNEWRNLKVYLLFNYMVHVLHKMPYDRRRKAYRLPQMIKRSFQHKLTAFFCGRSIRRRPKMSIALAAPKPKPPSNYNFVSKSLERPHSSS